MEKIIPSLLGVSGIQLYDEKVLPCYVYFLALGDEVVYVGQTVGLRGRLAEHKRTKEYDRVCYIEVPKHRLNEVEQAFIRAMKPVLNGTSKTDISNRDREILREYKADYLAAAKSFWQLEPVSVGGYGSVKIINGSDAGSNGYYDDDEFVCVDCWDECDGLDTCEKKQVAVVYPGAWTDGYRLMDYEEIRHLSNPSEKKEVGRKLLSCFPNVNPALIAQYFPKDIETFGEVECVMPVPGEAQLEFEVTT